MLGPPIPEPLPMSLTPRRSRFSAPPRTAGFVRHDLYLLVALVLLALAIALPRLFQGQWKAALAGLLILAGLVLGGLGLLLAVEWLQGATGRVARLLGHLLRFSLCGFIGAVLASALAANHRLGAQGENLAAAVAGLLSGLLGLALHRHLGRDRFWHGFRWLGLALLGAFLGGILGLLGPEPWSVDAGVLVPLLLFFFLARRGQGGARPSAPASDLRRHP